MVWVVAGVALLFLMLRFPAFGALVLIAVAGVGAYAYVEAQRSAAKYDAKQKLATSLERTSIVVFPASLGLSIGQFSSVLTGDAVNSSPVLSIRTFSVRVMVYDCIDITAIGCSIVGDETARVYTAIPPKQKRSFSQTLLFSGMPRLTTGQWSWRYAVTEVDAD